MKKLILTALLLIAAARTFADTIQQTTCPVMGGKINKELYVDANGYRIYVCCKQCIAVVKADPEKYIKKLQDQGVELEKTQTNNKPDEEQIPAAIERYRLYGDNRTTDRMKKSDPTGFRDELKKWGIPMHDDH